MESCQKQVDNNREQSEGWKFKTLNNLFLPHATAKLNDVGIMNPGDEEDDIIFDDVEDEDDDDGAVGYA